MTEYRILTGSRFQYEGNEGSGAGEPDELRRSGAGEPRGLRRR